MADTNFTLPAVPVAASDRSLGEQLRDTDYALLLFSQWELLIYLIWIPIVYFIARTAFLQICRAKLGREFSLENSLTEQDNKAMALGFGGFLFSAALVATGAMRDGERGSSANNLGQSIAWTMIGMVFLLFSAEANSRLLHRKIDNKTEMNKGNKAAGVIECCVYVASGIIVMNAISGTTKNWGEGFASALLLWFISELALIVFVEIYDRFEPADFQEEILNDNVAVAVSVGTAMLAMAIFLSNPTRKQVSIVAVLLWFAIGLIALGAFKLLASKVIVANALMRDQGGKPNWAIAGVHGAVIAFAASATQAFLELECRSVVFSKSFGDRLVDTDYPLRMFRWANLILLVFIVLVIVLTKVAFIFPRMTMLGFHGHGTSRTFFEELKHFLERRPEDPGLMPRPKGKRGNKAAKKEKTGQPKQADGEEDEREMTEVKVEGGDGRLRQENSLQRWSAEGAAAQPESGDLQREPTTVILQRQQAEYEEGVKNYDSALAVTYIGFIGGIHFVLKGALVATIDHDVEWYLVVAHCIMWSGIGFVGVALCFPIANFFLWGAMQPKLSNVALAFIQGASFLSTGMVIGSCIDGNSDTTSSNPSEFSWGQDIALVVIFLAITQVMLCIAGKIYQLVTKYNDIDEVRRGNVAAGLNAALTWISLAVVAADPLAKDGSLLNFFLCFILSVIVLQVMRLVVDKAILVGRKLDDEIVEDKNWGAAFIEGCTAVGTAFCLTAFQYPRAC